MASFAQHGFVAGVAELVGVALEDDDVALRHAGVLVQAADDLAAAPRDWRSSRNPARGSFRWPCPSADRVDLDADDIAVVAAVEEAAPGHLHVVGAGERLPCRAASSCGRRRRRWLGPPRRRRGWRTSTTRPGKGPGMPRGDARQFDGAAGERRRRVPIEPLPALEREPAERHARGKPKCGAKQKGAAGDAAKTGGRDLGGHDAYLSGGTTDGTRFARKPKSESQ